MNDEVNLIRLVRRLEREHGEEDTSAGTWIHAQGMLQKVKFARKLLDNVQDDERAQRFTDIRAKLAKVEAHYKAVEQPRPTRPPPLLPSIPRPPLSPDESVPADDLLPTDDLPTDDLPTDDLLPADTPIAPLPTSAATAVAPRFASTAVQQELMDHVAHMATQLKRNTLHFSELLRKDQAVVEDAKEKLESNFDVMQKERLRLRDHRGKSWGTTWLTVLVVFAVLILFVIMVGIIRLT